MISTLILTLSSMYKRITLILTLRYMLNASDRLNRSYHKIEFPLDLIICR